MLSPIASNTHTLFWISEYYKIFKGCSTNFFLNLVYKQMDRGGGLPSLGLTGNSY